MSDPRDEANVPPADASDQADAADVEAEQGDPALHGFDSDPFDERLARAVDAAHRLAAAVGRFWSWATQPFGFLLALREGFAEARLVQSPYRRLRDLVQALPAVAVVATALCVTIAGAVQQ